MNMAVLSRGGWKRMGSQSPLRVHAVDLGRTAALVGMVVFHTARDLEIFGVLPAGTTLSGFWFWFARLIAGSFFFFAGISLVLAHPDRIRWRAFRRRLLVLGMAACLVTLATYVAMPSMFVYFGILHSIAVCSVIALAFLRLPAVMPLAAALGILAIHLSDAHLFAAPIWSFSGLSATHWPSLDLLPIVPWLAVILMGVSVGKLWHPKATQAPRTIAILGWPGRHSLAIYLLHQPFLIAVIWLIVKIFQEWALLHKSGEGRPSPYPRRI